MNPEESNSAGVNSVGEVVDHASHVEPSGSGTPPSKKKIWKWVILGAVVLVVAVGGGTAYAAFGLGKNVMGYSMPEELWNGLIDSQINEAVDQKAKVEYIDNGEFTFTPSKYMEAMGFPMEPGEVAEYDSKYKFTLKNPGANFEFDGYTDTKDANAPKLDFAMKGELKNLDKAYAAAMELRLKETVAFVKFTLSDTITALFGKVDPATESEIKTYSDKWFKLTKDSSDFKDFQDAFKSGASEQDLNKVKDILRPNRVFDIKSFKGFGIENGTLTAHYGMEINKTNVKNIMLAVAKEEASASGLSDSENILKLYGKIVDVVLEKWEVKEFDVWFGVTDQKLYKTEFNSNMISLTGSLNLINQELENGNIRKTLETNIEPDLKKYSDASFIVNSLQYYSSDNGGYPEAVNGVPTALVPNYLSTFPVAPEPNGNCTAKYNGYLYSTVGSAKKGKDGINVYSDYNLVFCIGESSDLLDKGNVSFSTKGILPMVCPEGEKCLEDTARPKGMSPEEKVEQFTIDLLKKMPYTAELKVESSVESYGKEKAIEEPADSLDYEKEKQKFNEQVPLIQG